MVSRGIEMSIYRPRRLLPKAALHPVLSEQGLVCSLRREGHCWGNAGMARFWFNLRRERSSQKDYANLGKALHDIADDILRVCNRQRRHSKLGNLPPTAFAQKSAIPQPLDRCEKT